MISPRLALPDHLVTTYTAQSTSDSSLLPPLDGTNQSCSNSCLIASGVGSSPTPTDLSNETRCSSVKGCTILGSLGLVPSKRCCGRASWTGPPVIACSADDRLGKADLSSTCRQQRAMTVSPTPPRQNSHAYAHSSSLARHSPRFAQFISQDYRPTVSTTSLRSTQVGKEKSEQGKPGKQGNPTAPQLRE